MLSKVSSVHKMVSYVQFLRGKYMNCLVYCLLLILLCCGTASALSNDGGGTWDYSRDILIQENYGATLKDYNILLEFKEVNFPAQAQENGADIRFTDEDDNELNYWIEKFDSTTKKAKIWVKVPYIFANGQTKIRMYYGNPEAKSVSTQNILKYADVSGSWTGTLYQFDDERTGTFLFKLNLSQDGSKISGISKINALEPSEAYAIMEISGSVNDRVLNFKELRSIEEYSPGSTFFLKNVNLRFEDEFPSTLEGDWDCYWNSKTYGGTISLIRDISESTTNVTILEPQVLSLVVTKTVSPQSIRQFQKSTVTVKIKNIGRAAITDIQIVDSTSPSSFDLVEGNSSYLYKFNLLEPEREEEIQYTIKAKESGSFSLDPCTVTFADKELNIQEIKSEPVSLKVIPSITEQGEELSDNFLVLDFISTRKNLLIKYIIIILVGGVIFGSIMKKALKPITKTEISSYDSPEKKSVFIVNNSTQVQGFQTQNNIQESISANRSENNSLVREIIAAVISGLIVLAVSIMIQN